MTERRYNPLLDEWVLVSPHRSQRPWQGQVEEAAPPLPPHFDPGCYLCPGNARFGGARNPAYTSTFVFDNDFAALTPAVSPSAAAAASPLLRSEPASGICRVLCYSPRHDLTLPYLTTAAVTEVVDLWAAQYDELGARTGIQAVQIFENRGALMGASNPHPHGQIWATSHLPNQIVREQAALAAHQRRHGGCLLCEYGALEAEQGARLVCDNAAFLAVVPYWAVWPFETLLLSRRHCGTLGSLGTGERRQLAEILIRLNRIYDQLFQTPFPMSWGWHLAPTDGGAHPEAHLHAHFLPPLLRSATIRKFMVGYELLATPQRDLTPEQAAERLRAVSPPQQSDRLTKDGNR